MARLFVRLDAAWPDNPKIIRAGIDGAGLHAIAMCIAKRLETDGWVDRLLLVRHGASDELIDRCVDVGLLDVDGDRVRPHDWLVENPSQAAIDAGRASKREAARRGNHKKWRHGGDFESCATCHPSPQVVAGCDRIDSHADGSSDRGRSPEQEREREQETPPPSSQDNSQPDASSVDPVVVEQTVTRAVNRATRTAAETDPTVDNIEAVLTVRRPLVLAEHGDDLRALAAAGATVDDLVAWLAVQRAAASVPHAALGDSPRSDPTVRPALTDRTGIASAARPAAADPTAHLAAVKAALGQEAS